MTDTEYLALYDLLKQAISNEHGAETTLEWHALCAARSIAHKRYMEIKYPSRRADAA